MPTSIWGPALSQMYGAPQAAPTGYAPPQSAQNYSQPSGGISPEILSYLDQLNYSRMLTGQPQIEIPQTADPMEFATLLYSAGGADLGMQIAGQMGIPSDAFLANVQQVDQNAQANRGSNVFNSIGNLTRVGSGEVTGFGDFARDAAGLGAIGFGTTFLPGGAAAGGAPVAPAAAPVGASTGAWSPGAMGGASAGAGLPAVGGAAGYPVGASAGAWSPGAMGGATAAAAAPAAGGGFFDNMFGGAGEANPMGGLFGGSGNWGPLVGGLLGAADAHNQPDSMSSVYAPDPALTGAGQDALASMRAIFANGGPGVAGADPASLAAIQGLQGFASGGGINPYLDTVFNAAADSTQNRQASEFAHAGRFGSDSHQQSRSQELQNLAAGIYGPGYEAERGRQFGSLLPLLGGGDYLRGINQQQMDQPFNNAMRYSGGLNSLLGLFPGTNTQPLFNNPWAGFLGGAQMGSLFTGG